jgi:PhnB protein
VSGFQPEGYHTVTPRIIAGDPEKLVGFLKEVFGARGELHAGRPAEMRIGDSVVMISDGGAVRGPMPSFLYVYVEDVDSTYDRAVVARAKVIEPPTEMPYGDRRATIADPWGNLWQIATRRPQQRA